MGYRPVLVPLWIPVGGSSGLTAAGSPGGRSWRGCKCWRMCLYQNQNQNLAPPPGIWLLDLGVFKAQLI